jgi:polysaccharide export outer membrane protein
MQWFCSILILCVGAVLAGCTPPVVNPVPLSNIQSAQVDEKDAPYRIGVSDEIEIKFFFAPELNEITQVRPDGNISLMFAQKVQAVGKTPEELAADIKKAVSSHVKQADLVVLMHGFGSQKIYVGGEVSHPGSLQLSGHETILQVLNDAGWLTPSADHNKAVLVRRSGDGKEQIYLIHVDQIVTGKDMAQNIYTHAGDVVLVPPSDSVSFDRWMEQNVRQALPFSASASAVYTNQSWGGNR